MAVIWDSGIPEKQGMYVGIIRDFLTGKEYPEILRAKPIPNWPGVVRWERERDRAPLYDDEAVVSWAEIQMEKENRNADSD